MKVFALLSLAVVFCVDASIVNTGSSAVSRSDDGHGNYAFAYKEQHSSGGTTRSEKGGPGWAKGEYTLNDHDGRQRIVQYVADAHGYRAAIKTNEPGVDGKEDPAAVEINGGQGRVVAEPVLAYAEPKLGLGLGLVGAPLGIAEGRGLGLAVAEGRGLGGLGYGGLGGPLGSYSVSIHHAAVPELRVGKVLAAPIGYGKLGLW